MIKIMLKRRKESDTYLAALPLQLMKATVPAKSYSLYPLSSRSAYFGDVFCQQPGMCRSPSFFLTYIYKWLLTRYPADGNINCWFTTWPLRYTSLSFEMSMLRWHLFGRDPSWNKRKEFLFFFHIYDHFLISMKQNSEHTFFALYHKFGTVHSAEWSHLTIELIIWVPLGTGKDTFGYKLLRFIWTPALYNLKTNIDAIRTIKESHIGFKYDKW